MYLLKKIVGFGTGRSSNEASDDEPSRPVTPVQVQIALQPEHRQSKKKKKGRNKKHKSKIEDDEETEDGKDESVENAQQVPEIVLEDLSDQLKEDSTSQDVSSSDLSENVACEKSGDVDIWAERDDDDFVRKKNGDDDKPEEEVNFDDFWSEFDEGAGKVRAPRDRSSSLAAESARDSERHSSVAEDEDFQTGQTHNEPEKSISVDGSEYSVADLVTSEVAEENNNGKSEPEKVLAGDQEAEEIDDFWANHDEGEAYQTGKIHNQPEKSKKVGDCEYNVAGMVDSEVAEENKNVECEPEKEEAGDQEAEEIDDFWANHDEDEAFIARKTSLRSGSSHYSSESPEKSPDRSRSKSKSVGLGELPEETIENLEGNVGDGEVGSIWDDEDLPPIFEIKKSKSPSLSRWSLEENAGVGDSERGEKEDLPQNENDTADGLESRDIANGKDNFETDSDLPSDIEDNTESIPESGAKCVEHDDENDATEDESEENEDDGPSTKTESTSDKTASPEKTNSSTVESSGLDENSEKGTKDEEDFETKQSEDDSEEDSVHEVPKKKFSKSIQDLEAPTRRRSVIVPDNRERTEVKPPTPPPLPQSPPPFARSPPSSTRSSLRSESSVDGRSRTRHISETSTDGEGHDDGIMDFLGKENDRAEARLAARRQARVEAREIRMRELERVQKEQDENSDKVLELHCTTPPHINNSRQASMSPRERPTVTPTNSYHSSRRSSEDSMEDGLNLRDIRHELKEVEDKFRKAMIANAQLDNEKAAHAYQVELLKDRLEDLEEAHALLNREHREKCREHESLKRVALKLREDLTVCKMCLDERDRLIADHGLIIVGGELDETGEPTPRALVSKEAAEVLDAAGEGSLDVRLKALANEKNELVDEVRHLKLEIEEERNRRRAEERASNGPLPDDVQQTLNDYRFRLQKTEQETSTLQATVARLESQVIRYKSAAEESEKAEEELKQEKRKLLREHRESIARIEELETSNSHLQRRMDKLKNAKSTLLKEL